MADKSKAGAPRTDDMRRVAAGADDNDPAGRREDPAAIASMNRVPQAERIEGAPDLSDPLKQELYDLSSQEGRVSARIDKNAMKGERQADKGESPRGHGGQIPEDLGGAVRPPQEINEPGASAKLGGTPSAAAVKQGRQMD